MAIHLVQGGIEEAFTQQASVAGINGQPTLPGRNLGTFDDKRKIISKL